MKNAGEAPTAETLAEILARSRPELMRLFQRRWVTAEEAEAILEEAWTSLLLHWDRIDDPAPRLPAIADRIIRMRLEPPVPLDDLE